MIRPDLLELQARRNGIKRVDVAARARDQLRRPRRRLLSASRAAAARGIYPQETRLLPIVARPPLAEREDVGLINSLQIWSPVAGRMIPLSQVTSGTEVVWEDPIVVRRDRFPTLTVHADPRTGLPSQLFNRVRAQDRSDRAARRATRSSGAANTKTPATPAPRSPGRCPTCWRSWCSSWSACSTRFARRCWSG